VAQGAARHWTPHESKQVRTGYRPVYDIIQPAMGLAAGTRAGHYEILGPLGAGGMAEVYRARDTRLGRDVALKVLPAAFAADPERVRRFEREARAISVLNHPNILAVYDVGSHSGLPYLVTELLEGETLSKRLGHGALSLRKALDYAQQAARGLAAAHEKGVVHRDLKPENLFVTRDGIVKILDFGLAKLSPAGVQGEKALLGDLATEMGATLGTVGYMSPEQVRGEPSDHRSDIFSFGAILYEMLSGQPAFDAPMGAERMVRILKDDPAPLAISPSLDQVMRHCLEKNPEDRFHSARDLGFALQAFSASETSGSSPSRIAQVVAAKRRVWLQKSAIAVALVAAGLIAGKLMWDARGPLLPLFHQLTFRRGRVGTARFVADGRTVVYSASWDGTAPQVFALRPEYPESRPAGDPMTVLAAVTPGGDLGILRNARYLHHTEWRGTLAVEPLDGGAPRDLLDDVQGADWDPSASAPQRVAAVRQDAASGKTRLEYPVGKVLYETAGWISFPRVSPRGDQVAFLDHPVLNDSLGSVMVADTAANRKTLSSGWAAEAGLAWSPGGREVAFSATRAGSTLAVYAATLDGTLRQLLSSPERLTVMDVSRDGRLLVTAESTRSALMANIAGQDGERDLSWLDHSFRPHLSADGKWLLFTEGASAAGPHYSVCLRKTDGSPVVRLGEGTALGLSPDGKWALALVSTTPAQLVLMPTGAGQTRTLDRGPIEAYGFGSWLPDGKTVLFIGHEPGQPERAYLQDVSGGKPRRALAEGYLPVPEAVSPDGRIVACRQEGGPYKLCPLGGGEPKLLNDIQAGEAPLGWSADGGSLYIGDLSRLPVDISKVDTATGRRHPWKLIRPADSAGLVDASGISITPDGRSFVVTYVRILNALFTVEGAQ
jgi:Tol biopolymer transport system component